MRILHVNDHVKDVAGAEVAIRNIIEQSSHEHELVASINIKDTDLKQYDLLHLHNVYKVLPCRKLLNKTRYILSVHDHRLKCPNPTGVCKVLKINCVQCMGLLRYPIRRVKHHGPYIELVKKARAVVVHSEYMKHQYSGYNPVYLPIPLEVKEMHPGQTDEGYLFYSARASPEKNPQDFIRLCRELRRTGVMHIPDLMGKPDTKRLIKKLRSENTRIITGVTRQELFDLYRRAHLTVHPHLYAEPFGIGSANSILLGTPLVAYPYGNLANLATATAANYPRLKHIVEQTYGDPDYYSGLKNAAITRRTELIAEHNSIERWDQCYEQT